MRRPSTVLIALLAAGSFAVGTQSASADTNHYTNTATNGWKTLFAPLSVDKPNDDIGLDLTSPSNGQLQIRTRPCGGTEPWKLRPNLKGDGQGARLIVKDGKVGCHVIQFRRPTPSSETATRFYVTIYQGYDIA